MRELCLILDRLFDRCIQCIGNEAIPIIFIIAVAPKLIVVTYEMPAYMDIKPHKAEISNKKSPIKLFASFRSGGA